MIPANLGVNPSLTITAMAEHAMRPHPPEGARVGVAAPPPQARAASANALAPVLEPIS